MDLEALKRSVIIILKADGSVAGTGFVISDRMAVTCAHVIEFTKVSIGSSVGIRFYASNTESLATVMKQGWCSPKEDDIAFLELWTCHPAVKPALLRTAKESAQHTYVAFGFAKISSYDERIAEGEIGGVVKARSKSSMLQLTGYEVAQGLSGAPVLDQENGCVVGMISEYADDSIDVKKTPTIRLSGTRFAWATTADTLKARMPTLQLTSTLTDWQQWSNERRSVLIRETRERVGESPLMEYWQSFIANEPWIDLVKNAINKVIHVASGIGGFEDLIFQLKSVNTSTIYPQVRREIQEFKYKYYQHAIRSRLEEVHRQIREIDPHKRRDYLSEKEKLELLRKRLYDLLDALGDMEKIAKQSYNCSFLVLGRIGSGRTHFVNQVVEKTLSTGTVVKYLCILLDRTRSAPNLEESILQALSQATRQKWRDIRSWHSWMQTNYSGVKTILIIDDLQYWIASRVNFLEDLANTIIETTHYHAFLWLITADTASYPRLQSKANIWSDYGFYIADTPVINNWIVLENINEIRRVGERIIRSNWPSGINDSVLEFAHTSLRNKPVYLQMPFVAWIFLDLQLKLPQIEYITWNINFIQFIEHFWEIRWQYLLGLMSEARSLQLTEKIVRDIIIYCAHLGSQSNGYIFDYNQVIDSIITENSRYSMPDVQDGLKILAHGDLIDIQKKESTSTPVYSLLQHESWCVRLYFEPFWDFHIAAQMFKRFYTDLEQNKAPSISSVTQLFHQINTGVLTFLLLLADQELGDSPNDIQHQFPQVLSEVALEIDGFAAAAVYQAAVRASPGLQSFILGKINSDTDSEGDGVSEGLFEQLNFISEALRDELTMDGRLKLLRMRYPVAAQAKFGDYVCYLVHTWLQRAQSSNEIVLALPDFEGCEVLGVTESLAKLTVEGLLHTIRLDGPVRRGHDALLNIFLQYALRYGSPETYQRPYHQTAEERTYFHEWFLYWVCQLLVSDMGWQSYEIFKSHGWYDNASGRFANAFALRMRRESNWALGYWYQQANRWERQHFENLVKSLANSASARDRETAFFLIRHTKPTGKLSAVRVRPVFHTILRKLFLDPELDGLVSRYYELFQVNFTEEAFRELENQRQSRRNRSGRNRRSRN